MHIKYDYLNKLTPGARLRKVMEIYCSEVFRLVQFNMYTYRQMGKVHRCHALYFNGLSTMRDWLNLEKRKFLENGDSDIEMWMAAISEFDPTIHRYGTCFLKRKFLLTLVTKALAATYDHPMLSDITCPLAYADYKTRPSLLRTRPIVRLP